MEERGSTGRLLYLVSYYQQYGTLQCLSQWDHNFLVPVDLDLVSSFFKSHLELHRIKPRLRLGKCI